MADVALTLTAAIPEEVLERYVPASPLVVGAQLAEGVGAYARSHRLGYFPAVDALRNHDALDADLLNAMDGIAWVVQRLMRNEIKHRLRPLFARVVLDSVQCAAYTLPRVRPMQSDWHSALARHYTPDSVRVGLLLDVFDRERNPEHMHRWAQQLVYRRMSDGVRSLDVTGASRV